jgi:hypothetical protein
MSKGKRIAGTEHMIKVTIINSEQNSNKKLAGEPQRADQNVTVLSTKLPHVLRRPVAALPTVTKSRRRRQE